MYGCMETTNTAMYNVECIIKDKKATKRQKQLVISNLGVLSHLFQL